MGIANVIPGLSGGTLAVIFNIYTEIIDALNRVFQHPLQTLKRMSYYLIGIFLGVIAAIFLVSSMYKHAPIPTSFLFIGFIFGGVPFLYRSIEIPRLKLKGFLLMGVFFCVIAFMPFLQERQAVFYEGIMGGIVLLLLGAVAAGAMVIPGFSGSMLLMALGHYQNVIELLKNSVRALVTLDFTAFGNHFYLLTMFALGIVLGIVLIAKVIKWVMIHHKNAFFYAVLGMVLASPISVVYFINGSTIGLLDILLGAISLILGIVVSHKLILLK